MHTRYRPEEWMHVYTNVSSTNFESDAGAGGTCSLFSFYCHAGRRKKFDGEVFAIQTAMKNVLKRKDLFNNIVIFLDSKVTIQDSVRPNSSRIMECHKIIYSLHKDVKVTVLQWIPSDCRIRIN